MDLQLHMANEELIYTNKHAFLLYNPSLTFVALFKNDEVLNISGSTDKHNLSADKHHLSIDDANIRKDVNKC